MIVEILNDDGTMARRPDLELFARTHGLKIGTIADLIRYRLKNERSVERIYDSRSIPNTGVSGCAATRITSTRTCTSRWSRAI
jgi:3,4-dihydroxy 2-butanone 4-phosphate synthase/GTP cyclohydrolase II